MLLTDRQQRASRRTKLSPGNTSAVVWCKCSVFLSCVVLLVKMFSSFSCVFSICVYFLKSQCINFCNIKYSNTQKFGKEFLAMSHYQTVMHMV